MEQLHDGHAVSIKNVTISEEAYAQMCAPLTAGNCQLQTYNREEKRLIQCPEPAVIREVHRAHGAFPACNTDVCLRHALKCTASATLEEAIEKTKKFPDIEDVIKLIN